MSERSDKEFHLSVVATSRNDNHGGYLTHRMQHFVDGFVAQCKRHGLRAELLLVEWNPPADRAPLAEELKWPQDPGPCEIRIVTVPREMHAAVPHGDQLPLFQMIAKNVGIRRARGRFVLATNIDILFSDEVMRAMRDDLEEGRLYRVDRYDIPTEVPASPDFGQVLEFCRREQFRVHATGFTLVRKDGKWSPRSPLAAIAEVAWRGAFSRKKTSGGGESAQGDSSIARETARSLYRKALSAWYLLRWVYTALIKRELFTNACGDFTLLSKKDWSALRGYPEWAMYSWHLDSILLYQSHRSGIREIYLGRSAPIYHIEHSPGSGFTPESSDKLFERLAARGIPYLDWHKDVLPMIAEMDKKRRAGESVLYNDPDWGYAAKSLPDQIVAASA